MPKIVVDPKGRYSWEANFNPALQMSNNAINSVMFKMEIERAKYFNAIKRLNRDAKSERRLTEREVEEVKLDLQKLRAYRKVAELTAFKKFDPEIKRRKRAQEKREAERREQEKAEEEEKRLNELVTKEREDVKQRLKRRRQEEEQRRSGINYSDMTLFSRKSSIDGSKYKINASDEEKEEDDLVELQRHARRLSIRGDVFVTLQDIVDNDDVLRRHSQDLSLGSNTKRRSSQDFSAVRSQASNRRRSSVMSSSTPNLTDYTDGMAYPTSETFVSQLSKQGTKEQTPSETSVPVQPHTRRRSRLGSVSLLMQAVIKEDNSHSDTEIEGSAQTPSIGEEVKTSIFMTDVSEDAQSSGGYVEDTREKMKQTIKFQKQTLTFEKNDKSSLPLKAPTSMNHQDLCNKKTKTEKIAKIPIKRQGIFEILGQLKEQADPISSDSELPEPETIPDATNEEVTNKSCEDNGQFDTNGSKLQGLNKFRSIVTTVTEKNKEKRGENISQMKRLAAAVIMADSRVQGKMPSGFMLNHISSALRRGLKKRSSTLETVHRQPEQMKLRPLQMPKSVQRQHEEKWQELMASVNGAIHWKVRALRENTGTLNPRQLRRQRRNEDLQHQELQQQQQQKHESGNIVADTTTSSTTTPLPAVAVSRRHRRRREKVQLPGSCATAWSMKRFVQNNVQEVLASWQPENARKLRSQRIIKSMAAVDNLTASMDKLLATATAHGADNDKSRIDDAGRESTKTSITNNR